MLCVGLRTSNTNRIHMEASVTEKKSAFHYMALGVRVQSASCDMQQQSLVVLGWLALEFDHLCPRRGNIYGSAQFPSAAPKKRLIQSFNSHLDDPEVRGWG